MTICGSVCGITDVFVVTYSVANSCAISHVITSRGTFSCGWTDDVHCFSGFIIAVAFSVGEKFRVLKIERNMQSFAIFVQSLSRNTRSCTKVLTHRNIAAF